MVFENRNFSIFQVESQVSVGLPCQEFIHVKVIASSVSLATACTGCVNSCASGLVLSLTQATSSAWTGGGGGFTTYQFSWLAPSATSATIQFQFYTTTSGNYWDVDNVSAKNTSGTELIANGGLSTKASWNEACGISSCASIQNYGPSSSPNYWVNCINSTNYYSVSQTFPILPCGTYNITFQMARYKGSTNTANAFVYIY